MKDRLIAVAFTAIAVCALFASCSTTKDDKPQKPDYSGTLNIDDDNTGPTTDASDSEGSSEAVQTPSSDTSLSESESNTQPPQSVETTVPQTPPTGEIDRDNTIVQTAEALIGIPFTENGSTPAEGFDNSGFIYYVLRENGFINCPRLIRDQSVMGENVGYSDLKSGDLAFFTNGGGTADFGGIYIGNGKMIFCPMPEQAVREADITTAYWQDCFVTGVRLS